MSIYGTVHSIDNPITYYGSHVHPYEHHARTRAATREAALLASGQHPLFPLET